MSNSFIVAMLVVLAIISAALSFLAWYRLGRPPAGPAEDEESQLDSEDPPV